MMDRAYIMKKMYMVAVVLLIVGGFNAGVCALTGRDVISSLFGRRSLLTNALLLGMGVAALALAFMRDVYLPFLGEAVMPCSLLSPSAPEGADTKVRVHAGHPGAKVMYWAAEPKNEDLKGIQDWRKAYLGFRNAGVAIADAGGVAELAVRAPQAYAVPMKGALNPHIHYRVCRNDGMMERVETTFVAAGAVEGGAVEGFVADYAAGELADMVEPSTALAEINATAQRTAAQSLMTETGALDEAEPGFHGAAF